MVNQTQKKNVKSSNVETTPVEVVAPVVPVVEVATPVEVMAPVVAATKKAAPKKPATKKATSKTDVASVDVASTTPNVATPKARKSAKKTESKTETPSVAATPALKTQKGGKKIIKTDTSVVTAPATTEVDEVDEGKSRSFKVKLPNEEEFCGRFTGLTPYQAANKALSKYFRTNENNNITSDQILFSIKESTRGSKRHEYVYKGTRVKLEQPIMYTIKSADGNDRVITKQYKNQLAKVKKGNTVTKAEKVKKGNIVTKVATNA